MTRKQLNKINFNQDTLIDLGNGKPKRLASVDYLKELIGVVENGFVTLHSIEQCKIYRKK